jgi:hypothetical protein
MLLEHVSNLVNGNMKVVINHIYRELTGFYQTLFNINFFLQALALN